MWVQQVGVGVEDPLGHDVPQLSLASTVASEPPSLTLIPPRTEVTSSGRRGRGDEFIQ
jgi:hypothetical protein